jgi:hypothetical protein
MDQVVPVVLSEKMIRHEAKHLNNTVDIEVSFSCTLSKVMELFIMELTMSAYHCSSFPINDWKLKVSLYLHDVALG